MRIKSVRGQPRVNNGFLRLTCWHIGKSQSTTTLRLVFQRGVQLVTKYTDSE
jgi:hypothetical protein